MDAILTGRALLRLSSVIHQVTVDIMLEDESRGVKPIIEDLTSHNVPPDTPAVLPALVPQPVMTQHLRVKVVCLETRMMNMTFGTFEEEKAVVVDKLLSAVKSAEGVELAASWIVDQL